MLSGYFYSHYKFQFTPLREGRQLLQGSVRQSHYFNSRPSARGDSHDQALFPTEQDISIHAPPRGATSYFDSVPHKATKFQFTPLREGRPSTNSIKDGTSAISIHAPPRGATHRHWYILRLHRDFNSRPSARGDKVFRITSDARDIFQFTPLREGRRAYARAAAFRRAISIHAPPRGATRAAVESAR